MNKSTILVVDDEQFFHRLYSEILGEEKYELEFLSSGDEAVARLAQGGVDLVLTDLVMPGLSGLDVLRFTRTLTNPPDVILVTGHATVESAIQALKNGAKDFLLKPFNPDELRHLVRTCLEQRRLLDENKLLKHQIRLFQRGQNLAFLLETDRLLQQAVVTLRDEIGEGRGFAFLFEEKKQVKVLGLDGIEEAQAESLALACQKQVGDLSGMRLVRGGELGLPQELTRQADVRSVCLFPLYCQKKLEGAIVLINAPGREFPHPFPHENLLFIADQTALGFENAFRYQGAQELIYTDDLTGLYNYRYLQIALDQEIRRAERYGLEFSVVFLDLDLFKKVNDSFGHIAGSAALKEVATLLHTTVREVDTLFRYGGDEFTALLVETDTRGAAVVAERMRRTIAEHVFLQNQGYDTRMTVTVGYATYPENAADTKTILHLADQAMYDGKKERNVTRGIWELMSR